MNTPRLPTLFISHGGGPWPYVEDMRKLFAKTEAGLQGIPGRLPCLPKAILVVSGHWEEDEFTVATSAQPPMVYDYYGFPEHTYHIKYPAPGSPQLASGVRELLTHSGITCHEDANRGFDHGMFVPLYLMYPQADVPVVMLSMKSGYDPMEHIRLGEALQPLRDEGVLIMGSGLTYHNLRKFGPQGAEASKQFEEWLYHAVSEPDAAIRAKLLNDWETAPSARLAHPQEDHLIPLMVVAGAAGKSVGERIVMDQVWDVVMASYWFLDK